MERGTVASGRRSSQAPEPTCEWLMREVASRCGTVAPAFCESKESHASLATSHAPLLTTADSECCERHEEDVPSASPNRAARGGFFCVKSKVWTVSVRFRGCAFM